MEATTCCAIVQCGECQGWGLLPSLGGPALGSPLRIEDLAALRPCPFCDGEGFVRSDRMPLSAARPA